MFKTMGFFKWFIWFGKTNSYKVKYLTSSSSWTNWFHAYTWW